MNFDYALFKLIGRNPIKITFDKQKLLDVIRQHYEEKDYGIKYANDAIYYGTRMEYFTVTKEKEQNSELIVKLMDEKDETLVIPSIKTKKDPLFYIFEIVFIIVSVYVILKGFAYFVTIGDELFLSYMSGLTKLIVGMIIFLIGILFVVSGVSLAFRLAEDLPGKRDTNGMKKELREFEIFIKEKERELGKGYRKDS